MEIRVFLVMLLGSCHPALGRQFSSRNSQLLTSDSSGEDVLKELGVDIKSEGKAIFFNEKTYQDKLYLCWRPLAQELATGALVRGLRISPLRGGHEQGASGRTKRLCFCREVRAGNQFAAHGGRPNGLGCLS